MMRVGHASDSQSLLRYLVLNADEELALALKCKLKRDNRLIRDYIEDYQEGELRDIGLGSAAAQ